MHKLIGAVVVLMAACSPSSNGGTDASVGDTPAVKDVAPEAAACEAPRTLCAGACIDTQTAHRHCGMCGRVCDGLERCVNGACVRAGVCPARGTCRANADCRVCTLEGDVANWCCSARAQNPTCILELGPRCPENP